MPLSSRGFQVGAMPTSGALDPRMFLDARAVQPNVAGRTALAAFLAAKKRQMDEAQQTKENEFTDRRLKVQEGQEERLSESSKKLNELRDKQEERTSKMFELDAEIKRYKAQIAQAEAANATDEDLQDLARRAAEAQTKKAELELELSKTNSEILSMRAETDRMNAETGRINALTRSQQLQNGENNQNITIGDQDYKVTTNQLIAFDRWRQENPQDPKGLGNKMSNSEYEIAKRAALSAIMSLQQDGQQQEQAPTVDTQEEYDALPSGAVYIDASDGKKYRKP